MKKQKIFTIREINVETKNEFKSFLRTTEDNKPIRIYFESWGGNAYVGMVMETFIYYMKKHYPTRRFIMKGDIAASAAFRIFIRGDERIVTPGSIIQPHLPEPNDYGSATSIASIAREQSNAIATITAILPLVTRNDVMNYNNFPLPVTFMVKKKVVTEVVSRL